ncbi:MAG: hypothetical protein CMH56_01320 [Myxococcales bacterium]|nr:hypothetical protein [Myxococcales bacterium]|tara:strand:- start:1590 stop:3083 length:1494 start_codon:yes stop_codon:yes gene_type:complete
MKKSRRWSLLLTGLVVLMAPPSLANDETATEAAPPTDEVTPPPPIPSVFKREAPTKAAPAPAFVSESEGEEKSLLLRDGTRVKGKVVRADAEFIVIATSLGELAVPRSAIQPTFLRLELLDGDIIVGELLAENEDSFLIDGVFGQMEIRRDQISGFERAYFKDQLARIPGTSTGSADSFARAKAEGGQRFSHSSIEPLIDIFFSPTGYTFAKGDIYISGLSLGYGFTDNFHATVNILELVGLNSLQSPNLRATAKWNFFKRKNAKREWLMAAVLAGDVQTRLGTSSSIIRDVQLTRNSTGNDDQTDPADSQWQIQSQGDSTTTFQRSSNFFGDSDEDESSREEYYFTDVQVGEEDYYSCYSNSDPTEQTTALASCYSQDGQSASGSRGELFLANTYSWLLDRGGRFGWHNGLKLSVDTRNYDNWAADPTYRVYSAFDLDLNPKIKLLGEVFFDPNYKSLFTDLEDVGLDVGMMYAFTTNFRVMFHLDAPFIGLFWRF